MRVGQRGAPPVAAPQVELLAVVLKDVEAVRREAVLVTRVEQDHFAGVECEVGPDEEQVEGLAGRLLVEPLDPDDPCRNVLVQRLQGERVMPAPLAEGFDLRDQGGSVAHGPVATPGRGSRQHRGWLDTGTRSATAYRHNWKLPVEGPSGDWRGALRVRRIEVAPER